MSSFQEESSDTSASQSYGEYPMPLNKGGKRTMRMRSLQGQNLGNGKKKGGNGKGKSSHKSSHGFDGHIAPFLESKYSIVYMWYDRNYTIHRIYIYMII